MQKIFETLYFSKQKSQPARPTIFTSFYGRMRSLLILSFNPALARPLQEDFLSATSFPIYSVAKALVRYLPGFLLRRYYTPERLASLVYCDVLPRGESVQLDLGPEASARLFLQLINLSPF